MPATAVEVLHDDGRWHLAQLLHATPRPGGWRCAVRYWSRRASSSSGPSGRTGAVPYRTMQPMTTALIDCTFIARARLTQPRHLLPQGAAARPVRP